MKRLSLGKAVEFYLQQRRQLGFRLKEDGQMLHQLAGYAAEQGHRGASNPATGSGLGSSSGSSQSALVGPALGCGAAFCHVLERL